MKQNSSFLARRTALFIKKTAVLFFALIFMCLMFSQTALAEEAQEVLAQETDQEEATVITEQVEDQEMIPEEEILQPEENDQTQFSEEEKAMPAEAEPEEPAVEEQPAIEEETASEEPTETEEENSEPAAEEPAAEEKPSDTEESVEEMEEPAEDETAAVEEMQPETEEEEPVEETMTEVESQVAAEDVSEIEEEIQDTQEEELPAQEDRASLSVGMTGEDVLKMQKALKELNYLFATPDGIFGGQSLMAVKRFQLYNCLPVTGTADSETLALLYQGSAQAYRTLWKGSTGKAVYGVQQYLYNAGFLPVYPDGSFGTYTEAAVRAFQAQAGLESPDGGVGNWTTAQLIENTETFKVNKIGSQGNTVLLLQAKLSELGFLSAQPDGIFGGYTQRAIKKFQMYYGMRSTGVADASTVNAIYRGACTFSGLMKGSQGTAVRMLQKILKGLGYLTVEPDGIYGNYTVQAVRNFQIINSLPRDGSFGKNTAEKLFSDPIAFDQELLDNAESEVEMMSKAVLDKVGWDLYSAYKWSVGISYNINLDCGSTTTENAIYSFSTHYGNCISMASTFCWMARVLGYEAVVIDGQVPYRSGGFGEHAWVEIKVDGATYVCDPDFEMQTGRNGYMINYGQSGTWLYVYGSVYGD